MSARRVLFDALVAGRPVSELDAVQLLDDHGAEVLREVRRTRERKVQERPHADHAAAARKLRQVPGKWRVVAVYMALQTAQDVCWKVRTAALASYAPAGAFEAKASLTKTGTRLYVRYVGVTGE
ncbi:hypothetical protein IPZ58_07830 [Streptomyces roseoverticillatus]|uniref:hypothetical protein n=1 Tax=Streptomyces roseoverticillatus TaxID=66429 RepID=UPI001F16D7D8|nr:hypothetical protein [Streptomyces roseoverticillatus]MCF3101488.1 hypothetical protein [Streptomyces roseoverticillatus]